MSGQAYNSHNNKTSGLTLIPAHSFALFSFQTRVVIEPSRAWGYRTRLEQARAEFGIYVRSRLVENLVETPIELDWSFENLKLKTKIKNFSYTQSTQNYHTKACDRERRNIILSISNEIKRMGQL